MLGWKIFVMILVAPLTYMYCTRMALELTVVTDLGICQDQPISTFSLEGG